MEGENRIKAETWLTLKIPSADNLSEWDRAGLACTPFSSSECICSEYIYGNIIEEIIEEEKNRTRIIKTVHIHNLNQKVCTRV